MRFAHGSLEHDVHEYSLPMYDCNVFAAGGMRHAVHQHSRRRHNDYD